MGIEEYLGRTYDVSAFANISPDRETLLTQTLLGGVSGTGYIVTGIQKLAQRFLLEFLTVQGSIPFKTERGSQFITLVRQGRIQSELDAYAIFSFSLGDVETNLQAEEETTDPDDERYAGATLLSVTFSRTMLVLTVQVTSLAGTSRTVVLPTQLTL